MRPDDTDRNQFLTVCGPGGEREVIEGEAAIEKLTLSLELHDEVRLQNDVLAIPSDQILLA
jgi:hypothetical protein